MGKNDDGTIRVETVVADGERADETSIDNDNDNGGDDDDENLESLMSSFGDDFLTTEEAEANAARERRRKRKRRLERLQAAEAHADFDAVVPPPATKSQKICTGTVQKEPVTNEEPTKNIERGDGVAKDNGVADAGTSSASDDDSDSDDSDMFGSPSSEEKANKQKKRKKPKATKQNNGEKKTAARQDGFDDTDGYYKTSIGETMELEVLGIGDGDDGGDEARTLRLRVLGVIGKGVFSSVLKCSTTTNAAGAPLSTHGDGIPTTISLGGSSDQQQHGLPSEVAIKCIRSNETMAKAALDEMKFLIRLRDSPGIVPLLYPSGPTPASNGNNSNGTTAANPNYVPPPIDFRGHTVLVFPYLPYNLRDVLQKFGKGVGLSLGAVKNYYGQLLSAAKHLQTKRVIHADIKPDNILVSTDFSRVVLADFGSALESTVDESSEEGGRPEGGGGGSATHEAVTPYLVSRFYRAPEIILGLQPLTHAIDLWSLAVTAGELFLGKVLLKGASNNDMLHAMMALLGPFSGRLIKSHLLQTKKHPLQAHFSQVQSTYVFRQETVDPVLGRAVHKEVSLAGGAFSATLQSKLLRAKSPKDTRTEILLFADLLTKCLLLDPSKRVSVRAALKHGFFVRQQPQQQQQQQH